MGFTHIVLLQSYVFIKQTYACGDSQTVGEVDSDAEQIQHVFQFAGLTSAQPQLSGHVAAALCLLSHSTHAMKHTTAAQSELVRLRIAYSSL